MDAQVGQETKKRLIVVIPESLINNINLAHKIHWMAFQKQFDVLYLALVQDNLNALTVERYMATMKAVTAGNWLEVNWKLVPAADWISVVQDVYCLGDVVVCQAEHMVEKGWFKKLPASEVVKSTGDMQVITMSGFFAQPAVHDRRFSELLTWAGFIIIMAIFTWLEIRLNNSIQGGIGKTAVVMAMCLEVGFIWAWNSLTYS